MMHELHAPDNNPNSFIPMWTDGVPALFARDNRTGEMIGNPFNAMADAQAKADLTSGILQLLAGIQAQFPDPETCPPLLVEVSKDVYGYLKENLHIPEALLERVMLGAIENMHKQRPEWFSE